MAARLRRANGLAFLAFCLLAGSGSGRTKRLFFLFHAAAALLALLAARATAGRVLRGWTIGTNAWCVILDSLMLAANADAGLRGLVPWAWPLAIAVGLPLASATLCALNLRALVGPRDVDAGA